MAIINNVSAYQLRQYDIAKRNGQAPDVASVNARDVTDKLSKQNSRIIDRKPPVYTETKTSAANRHTLAAFLTSKTPAGETPPYIPPINSAGAEKNKLVATQTPPYVPPINNGKNAATDKVDYSESPPNEAHSDDAVIPQTTKKTIHYLGPPVKQINPDADVKGTDKPPVDFLGTLYQKKEDKDSSIDALPIYAYSPAQLREYTRPTGDAPLPPYAFSPPNEAPNGDVHHLPPYAFSPPNPAFGGRLDTEDKLAPEYLGPPTSDINAKLPPYAFSPPNPAFGGRLDTEDKLAPEYLGPPTSDINAKLPPYAFSPPNPAFGGRLDTEDKLAPEYLGPPTSDINAKLPPYAFSPPNPAFGGRLDTEAPNGDVHHLPPYAFSPPNEAPNGDVHHLPPYAFSPPNPAFGGRLDTEDKLAPEYLGPPTSDINAKLPPYAYSPPNEQPGEISASVSDVSTARYNKYNEAAASYFSKDTASALVDKLLV